MTYKIMKTIQTATLAGLMGLSAIVSNVNAEPTSGIVSTNNNQEQKTVAEKVDYTKKTAEAPVEKRFEGYTQPVFKTNPDGTVNKYFPIEDLLKNTGNHWTILYTDKNTKQVNSVEVYGAEVVRDLSTDQFPYAEKINCQVTWRSYPNETYDKSTIHLRNNDRIGGGQESHRNNRNQVSHTPIHAISLESKVEENK